MTGRTILAAVALLTTFGTVRAEDAPTSWDGLIEVKTKRMDAAFLLPGADFRPYAKVIIDPTQVAFKKDWLKDTNQNRPRLTSQVTEEQAADILAAARSNFDDIFNEAFTKAGYPVVTAPAADVMRVSTAVINLYLNAPDTMSSGRSRTYTANAGEATLVVEVRDSRTGALLARVVDRRETMNSPTPQLANRVSNTSDFRLLFKDWAGITVKGIEQLKALSPVPLDLQPKQKL
jgi:GTP:adenosylcobinamide-phosphate guanylyltransferase